MATHHHIRLFFCEREQTGATEHGTRYQTRPDSTMRPAFRAKTSETILDAWTELFKRRRAEQPEDMQPLTDVKAKSTIWNTWCHEWMEHLRYGKREAFRIVDGLLTDVPEGHAVEVTTGASEHGSFRYWLWLANLGEYTNHIIDRLATETLAQVMCFRPRAPAGSEVQCVCMALIFSSAPIYLIDIKRGVHDGIFSVTITEENMSWVEFESTALLCLPVDRVLRYS